MNQLLFLSLKQFIDLKKNDKNGNYGFCFPSFYNISRLKDKLPLSYNNSLLLIKYLNLQQDFLERNGFGFFILSIEDIIIIEVIDSSDSDSESSDSSDLDNLYFAYLNASHIKKINNIDRTKNKGNIVFMSPFSFKNCFYAPELLALSVIPAAVSYKCFYYSLGALVSYCLGLTSDLGLETIHNTKLYWLLKRIMVSEPNERILLLV
jgi:hypothetical protein